MSPTIAKFACGQLTTVITYNFETLFKRYLSSGCGRWRLTDRLQDHGHNIFGVRFLDRSGSMMATGANCSTVCISAFDRTIARYTCHKEAVSEIEQPPDQLSVFWSSSEVRRAEVRAHVQVA